MVAVLSAREVLGRSQGFRSGDGRGGGDGRWNVDRLHDGSLEIWRRGLGRERVTCNLDIGPVEEERAADESGQDCKVCHYDWSPATSPTISFERGWSPRVQWCCNQWTWFRSAKVLNSKGLQQVEKSGNGIQSCRVEQAE